MKVIKLIADEQNGDCFVTFENGETYSDMRIINAIELISTKDWSGKNILEAHVRNAYLKKFKYINKN